MSKIKSAFNQYIPFPQLLAAFEQWTDHYQNGEFGYFRFIPDRLTDDWIENGSQLANQFSLWLRLADGSMIGFWRPEYFTDDDILPVVLLGSEGEVEVLGESLEAFLYKWGNHGDFKNACDLMPYEDPQTEYKHHLILDWLKQNNIACPSISQPVTTQQLACFFDDWQENLT